MKAMVYTSQTGFTQRYAQLLSQQVGVPAYSVKEAAGALPRESEIFYMGPIVAGGLKGLEKIMHRYTIRGAALVGMNPVGNGELWTEASINGGYSDGGARIFYLRGGYAPERIKGFTRLLMRQMARSVNKKILAKGDQATDQDREMLELFQKGGDFVRPENLAEIVRWWQEEPHEGILRTQPSLDI